MVQFGIIWIFICCITANNIEKEYNIDFTESENFVLTLDTHSRYKRQVHNNDSLLSSTSSTTELTPLRNDGSNKTTIQPSTTTNSSDLTRSTESQMDNETTTMTEKPTTAAYETTSIPTSYVKQSDNHTYYTSLILHDEDGFYWDELHNHTKHEVLSDKGHLTSSSLPLPFEMPFYGHNISKIQITTGGFLFMSPYVHRFLTFSQYVAPLMANFDTIAENSEILYKEYDNSFIVEWRNVNLNDQKHHGQFTFQTRLFQNGTIWLVYKKIPVPIADISFQNHPVKIGVSDAYFYDYIKNGIRYRRINLYHNVQVNDTLLTDKTVVILDPLPTCNLATDCDHCVSNDFDFQCSWCPNVWRCSDGLDWYKQEWDESGCSTSAGDTDDICLVTTTTSTTTTTTQAPPTTTTTPSTTTTTTTPSTTTTTIASTIVPTTTTTITTTPSTTTSTTTMPSTTTTKTTTTTTQIPSTTTTTTTPSTTTTTTTPSTTPSTTTPSTTTSSTTPSTTTTTPSTTSATPSTTTQKPSAPVVQALSNDKKSKDSNAAAVAVPVVILLLALVVLVTGWVYYAYKHPNTTSGQWLIENRPSRLKARIASKFKWNMQTGEKYRVKNENENIEITMDESVA